MINWLSEALIRHTRGFVFLVIVHHGLSISPVISEITSLVGLIARNVETMQHCNPFCRGQRIAQRGE